MGIGNNFVQNMHKTPLYKHIITKKDGQYYSIGWYAMLSEHHINMIKAGPKARATYILSGAANVRSFWHGILNKVLKISVQPSWSENFM